MIPPRFAPPRLLIALNAALLLLLGVVTLTPESLAQRTIGRATGEYQMLTGKFNGGEVQAVYIIDVANQELLALQWNASTASLDGVGYRNIGADGQFRPGR